LRVIAVRANLISAVAAMHRAGVAYIGSRVLKTIDQHSGIQKKKPVSIYERPSGYKKRECEHSEGKGELHFRDCRVENVTGSRNRTVGTGLNFGISDRLLYPKITAAWESKAKNNGSPAWKIGGKFLKAPRPADLANKHPRDLSNKGTNTTPEGQEREWPSPDVSNNYAKLTIFNS